MNDVLGWAYGIGIVLWLWDHFSHTTEAEFAVCHCNRSIKIAWWVPGTNWLWSRPFWAVMGALFWPIFILPYWLIIRPGLRRARRAMAAAEQAEAA